MKRLNLNGSLKIVVRFRYRNWKGEEATRTVVLHAIDKMSSDHEWHPGKWCLHGTDLDKDVKRTFDFDNILSDIQVL